MNGQQNVKTWYLSIFRNSFVKIKISIKYEENNGYFTWRPMYIYDISLPSPYNKKFVSEKFADKIKTIIVFQ